MNKFVLILCAIILLTSCTKELPFVGIEGISFENYPRVDGSTSCRVLNQMIACKLLGIRYKWTHSDFSTEWYLTSEDKEYENFLWDRVKTSQTHDSYMNLIDGNADIILTHRTISPDEKAHADAVGVTLVEIPIASDAFVFIIHQKNPVKSLTINEIQKIYTKGITNWSEVGGKKADINAYLRPRNSGSEEVFRTLVMDGLEPADFPESFYLLDMPWVFITMLWDEYGICYSFNNYADVILRNTDVPKIAINGISPNRNTVKNSTYPFISEVHVAIRSDLNHISMAYKLFEWLQSEEAKSTINECGFIPK